MHCWTSSHFKAPSSPVERFATQTVDYTVLTLESILGALERDLEAFLNRTHLNTGINGVWISYSGRHLGSSFIIYVSDEPSPTVMTSTHSDGCSFRALSRLLIAVASSCFCGYLIQPHQEGWLRPPDYEGVTDYSTSTRLTSIAGIVISVPPID
jgi:hypothetical protein